jgi:hypothetical protein
VIIDTKRPCLLPIYQTIPKADFASLMQEQDQIS